MRRRMGAAAEPTVSDRGRTVAFWKSGGPAAKAAADAALDARIEAVRAFPSDRAQDREYAS
ncbi:hypothetical protein [Streptomyces sp. NPDC051183]|uniref:hypothetical protein n=1 Tax=unclassified Streptomyces TaxID=2593676 RepID=UPI003421047B